MVFSLFLFNILFISFEYSSVASFQNLSRVPCVVVYYWWSGLLLCSPLFIQDSALWRVQEEHPHASVFLHILQMELPDQQACTCLRCLITNRFSCGKGGPAYLLLSGHMRFDHLPGLGSLVPTGGKRRKRQRHREKEKYLFSHPCLLDPSLLCY